MKDLYRRLGIEKSVANEQRIRDMVEASPALTGDEREDVREVLLNPARKVVYDRTHETLRIIGVLRGRLGLNEGAFWKQSRCFDFTVWAQSAAERGPRRAGLCMKFFFASMAALILLTTIAGIGLYRYDWDGLLRGTFQEMMKSLVSGEETLSLDPGEMIVLNEGDEDTPAGPPQEFETVESGSEGTGQPPEKKMYNEDVGYVATSRIPVGSRQEVSYCGSEVARPANAEVFLQRYRGNHSLLVRNTLGSDAIVKLRDRKGRTVLSFFIREGLTVHMDNIPRGDYKFQYAAGTDYSTKCERFLSHNAVASTLAYDRYKKIGEDPYEYSTLKEYTLGDPQKHDSPMAEIPVDEFLRD